LNFLNKETISSPLFLQQNQTVYHYHFQFVDYIYRPQTLESLSLVEFLQKFKKQKDGPKYISVERRFLPDHPQYVTHFLTPRMEFSIPILRCCRLPSPLFHPEKITLYQKMLLLAFYPHRNLLHDIDLANSLQELFDRWITERGLHKYALYNEDYWTAYNYKSLDDRERYFQEILDLHQNDNDVTSETSSDSSALSEVEHVDDLQDVFHTDPIGNGNAYPNISAFQNLSCILQYAEIRSNTSTELCLSYFNSEFQLTRTNLNDCKTSIPPTIYPDLDTRVRALRAAIVDVTFQPDSYSGLVPDFCTLAQISRHFQLNRQQHLALVTFGSVLLNNFADDLDIPNDIFSRLILGQCVGFLEGPAGYGKTFVIHALQSLVTAWKRPDSIKTAAQLGIAADGARGTTIHKLFHWNVRAKRSSSRHISADQESLSSTKLLILDECSVISQRIYGAIDQEFQTIFNNKLLLGGIHILLVGDWLQHHPVAGNPLFIAPELSEDSKLFSLRTRGFSIWHAINVVVTLEEDVRHHQYPEFAAILQRLRIGQYHPDDLDYLNQTCLARTTEDHLPPLLPFSFCPILVPSNTLRTEFTDALIQRLSENQPVFQINALFHNGTFTQQRSAFTIPDHHASRFCMKLFLSIGIPVVGVYNLNLLKNGTIGHVLYIESSDTDQDLNNYPSGIHILPTMPNAVYIRLLSNNSILRIIPRERFSCRFDLPSRHFSLKITQFPLAPAYSLTSEKIQGLTLNSVILAPIIHKTRPRPAPSSFYVNISRVRNPASMKFMQPLSEQQLCRFRPSPQTLEMVHHLHTIALRNPFLNYCFGNTFMNE
jgi:hypothetical protein